MVGLALAAAAFGAWGLLIYDLCHHHPLDAVSIGYHTLQLFALHAPHLDPPVPMQLHLGRWLAAMVVLGALARGLWKTFQSERRILWSRMRRGHVVICGLGRLGLQLAREFRAGDWRVVAIESGAAPGRIAAALDAGVAVIAGDACDPRSLARAAVGRASKVIAVCEDEQKNVAIAAAVGELVSRKGQTTGAFQAKSGTECLLFVADPRLRQTFRTAGLFPHSGSRYRVDVKGIDWFDLAARQALRDAPLDWETIGEGDPRVVHLVIVGLGPMGRHLAVQAGRIGHFANARKLKVTVIDERKSTRPAEFLSRYPKFPQVCDYSFLPIDVTSGGYPDPEAVVQALSQAGAGEELVTVAVCWDGTSRPITDAVEMLQGLERDDPTNLSIALALSRAGGGARQVLVFLTRRVGLGALLPEKGRGSAIGARVHAFGGLEQTWSLDSLLHEKDDAIAKAVHAVYCARNPKSTSTTSWDELPDDLKDSNRRAADHIPVKMRALGYRVAAVEKGKAEIQSFDGPQKELLAKMEHESWMAELLLKEYSFAPGSRDSQRKTHEDLQSWAELTKDTRKKDFDHVETIPAVLRGDKPDEGFRIYKRS